MSQVRGVSEFMEVSKTSSLRAETEPRPTPSAINEDDTDIDHIGHADA